MPTYHISPIELNRRVKAFSALLTSIYITTFGLLLFSSLPIIAVQHIRLITAGTFVVFVILILLLIRFFKTYVSTRITIGNNQVVSQSKFSTHKIAFSQIKAVRIVYSQKGDIREIGLTCQNGHQQYINGLADFSAFKKTLLSNLGNNLKLHENHEPIDYDHPLFYPIFGIAVSLTFFYLTKYAATLFLERQHLLTVSVSVYVLLLGAYFIIKKPLSVRYGHNTLRVDVIFGLIFIVLAVILMTTSI